jgi:hypothetical protein
MGIRTAADVLQVGPDRFTRQERDALRSWVLGYETVLRTKATLVPDRRDLGDLVARTQLERAALVAEVERLAKEQESECSDASARRPQLAARIAALESKLAAARSLLAERENEWPTSWQLRRKAMT